MPRAAHLVGSLPGASTDEAMSTAWDLLGRHLRGLPDGETGERRQWADRMFDRLAALPSMRVTRQGDRSEYDRLPELARPAPGALSVTDAAPGFAAAMVAAWPAYERLVPPAERSRVPFQVGVTGARGLSGYLFGRRAALSPVPVVGEALLAEITQVHSSGGRHVLVQVDLPVEQILVASAPSATRRTAARWLARGVTRFVGRMPAGIRLGVHLCLGDLNNRAGFRLWDLSPVVALANALGAAWPADRRLEYLHAPFAVADVPAPVAEEFYRPLQRLRLPEGTRFVAGFAHEHQALSDQRRIRDLTDAMTADALAEPPGVGAACGLGRRTDEDALAVLRNTASLVAD